MDAELGAKMLFRKFFLQAIILISGLLIGQAASAQEALDCESDDALTQLICGTDMLKTDHEVMNGIWLTWQQGINAQRMAYLEGEQSDWLAKRGECLEEDDPALCLQTRYEERIQVLTRERVFQSQEEVDGKVYRVVRAMTPLNFNELGVEAALDDIAYVQPDLQIAQDELLLPPEDNCPECSHERETRIKTAFESEEILITSKDVLEVLDGGDPLESHQVQVYDKAQQQKIGIIDLFVPSTVPFAKANLTGAIMIELERLNRAVKDNESGETLYYWAETKDNLDAMSEAQWDEMGLYPIVEGEKIAGFRYRADSFEFAPYGSSEYFSGFFLPIDALVAFVRPEYRASFK